MTLYVIVFVRDTSFGIMSSQLRMIRIIAILEATEMNIMEVVDKYYKEHPNTANIGFYREHMVVTKQPDMSLLKPEMSKL